MTGAVHLDLRYEDGKADLVSFNGAFVERLSQMQSLVQEGSHHCTDQIRQILLDVIGQHANHYSPFPYTEQVLLKLPNGRHMKFAIRFGKRDRRPADAVQCSENSSSPDLSEGDAELAIDDI